MGILKDMTGKRFGKLVVISRSTSTPRGLARWNCECDCGGSKIVCGASLRIGETKSCGCLSPEISRETFFKHGMKNTKEYRAWSNIKSRCYNKNLECYPYYGGRGIFVADEWKSDFLKFFNDMGHAPSPKHTIERIDNDGPYAPWNCEWASRKIQMRNTRRSRMFTANGETKSMAEWTEITGIHAATLLDRLKFGWCVQCAVTIPKNAGKCSHR